VTRDSGQRYNAFAIAAPGLELLVAEELSNLGIKKHETIDGGVEFTATRRQLYEANLQLRTASRVIVRLAKFRALSFAELERRARKIPWNLVLAPGQSVALRVTCRKSRLYHSGAVSERLERDLVARFNAVVTRSSPDDEVAGTQPVESQLIIVRFDHDRCTISADSSGALLHQRGYRTSIGKAPVRETLAAALVMVSEWDRTFPLLDPFCGSGTIPIEAALIAANIAPGKNRKFRFMQWPDFDSIEWLRVHSSAVKRENLQSLPSISGSDTNAGAIRAANENAVRAGVSDHIRFERMDALRMDPGTQAGWIVSNPPYGVRLGEPGEAERLLQEFGRTLRQRFAGWRVTLIASSEIHRIHGLAVAPGLQTTNGGLRVHVLTGSVPATNASGT
jgi:putative N6-adenine-specific DNA methylase